MASSFSGQFVLIPLAIAFSPFQLCFSSAFSRDLINSKPPWRTTTLVWPILGKIYTIPKLSASLSTNMILFFFFLCCLCQVTVRKQCSLVIFYPNEIKNYPRSISDLKQGICSSKLLYLMGLMTNKIKGKNPDILEQFHIGLKTNMQTYYCQKVCLRCHFLWLNLFFTTFSS